jgi:hypothetical protein
LGSGYVARWKAKRVRSTSFVSAGNRRLAGFFEGMRPDPNWAARKAALASQPAQGCRPSLLARLWEFIERPVHAQGCSGHFDSVGDPTDCSVSGCTSYYAVNSGGGCTDGWMDTGTTGCSGDGCPNNAENYSGCTNSDGCGGGGGGCGMPGSGCTENSDCCSGSCVGDECWDGQ